jgi:hypothetical protein
MNGPSRKHSCVSVYDYLHCFLFYLTLASITLSAFGSSKEIATCREHTDRHRTGSAYSVFDLGTRGYPHYLKLTIYFIAALSPGSEIWPGHNGGIWVGKYPQSPPQSGVWEEHAIGKLLRDAGHGCRRQSRVAPLQESWLSW